jgi:flagellar motor protein MotB
MVIEWIGRLRAHLMPTFEETMIMQFVRATSTAALFLLFGAIGPVYAQHDQQSEKQRPEKQQSGQRQGAPPPAQQQRAQQTHQQQPQQQRAQQTHQQQPRQQQAQQTQQQRPQQQQGQRSRQEQQQPQRTQQQAVAWQQQRGWLQQGGGWQGHSTWDQDRAQRWESDHRTWAQRGGYGGYYIPQDRFSLYFGSQHGFRMNYRPTIYMGYPRFSYGGFSFMLVDPWPENWAENWYDTDDLYIGYDNGYYLYDRRYPGMGLAITVAL